MIHGQSILEPLGKTSFFPEWPLKTISTQMYVINIYEKSRVHISPKLFDHKTELGILFVCLFCFEEKLKEEESCNTLWKEFI